MRLQVRMTGVLALSLLLSAAGFADGPATPKAKKKDSASGTATKTSPASQPAPAPAPAKAASARRDSNAYGWPRAELFGGYSYVRANASGKVTILGVPHPFSQGANFNGGSGSIAINANKWFGIAADVGGYYNGNIRSSKVSGTVISYLFGPRISLRNSTAWTPFFQALFGGVRGSADVPASQTGTTAMTFSRNVFAMVAGGGLDANVSKHISLRTFQAEYFLTNFTAPSGSGVNVNRQNNFRLSTGIVFRFGERQPPPVNPPSVSCSAERSSVVQDSGDVVGVHASATNPDGVPLTYSWTATGGSVDGTGADVRWNSRGTAPGTYTITSQVDDGRGNTTSCSADINVQPKPVPPPTMGCSVDRSTVLAGERAQVSATVSDQSGTPLTYTWQSNGGQIVGSGPNVQFDTTGLGAGSYSITGRVQNGKGGAADCSTSVTVQVPPPPPQALKISECRFRAASASVDNICKRVLDDIALRLQNDPKAKLVVVGYADPREPRPDRLAKVRAANAGKYLSREKGVADTRIEARGAQGQAGAGKENHRADLVWVPEGASY